MQIFNVVNSFCKSSYCSVKPLETPQFLAMLPSRPLKATALAHNGGQRANLSERGKTSSARKVTNSNKSHQTVQHAALPKPLETLPLDKSPTCVTASGCNLMVPSGSMYKGGARLSSMLPLFIIKISADGPAATTCRQKGSKRSRVEDIQTTN